MKMNEFLEDIYNEFVFTRRTNYEKKLAKKARRRAHKNTNWKALKPRKGWKRVKIGAYRYILERMPDSEKIMKKRIGKGLGRSRYLRR